MIRPLLVSIALAFSVPAAQAVTVVHTNDVLGDIEPCGCRNNPLGGMARKATFVKQLRDKSILQLDAGDLLFSSDSIPELLSEQARSQAAFLLEAHDELRHDAAVPGEKDFALGVDVFEKLRKKTSVKFLAANLLRRNGKSFLEHHAIFERKDENGKTVRIAVIGLVGEDLAWPKSLRAGPVIATARTELRAVRRSADYVIALTHQGFEKDVALARTVPGIDFIIGGHTQSFLQKPIKEGGAWIFQSSFRNQYVGAIPLAKNWSPESYQLIGLDAGYDSPVEAPSKIDELVKRFKTTVAEINSRQEARMMAAQPAPGGQKKFHTFPRCAECHLKQFDFWRKTNHTLALGALLDKQSSKNLECLGCHTVGLGDPRGFQDLSKLAEFIPASGRENEKSEPLTHEEMSAYMKRIHGAKSLKDPVRLRASEEEVPVRQSLNAFTRAWTPVQCENCHQPGQEHPFNGSYSKTVENSTCLKCHTAERAPEWYSKSTGQVDPEVLKSKRGLVSCPAGDLPEEE